MLRKILSAFTKRSSSKDDIGKAGNESAPDAPSASRRSFFAKAAVGTVAVSGTVGLAKAVVDSVSEPDVSEQYRRDALAGEQDLSRREYVLMSDAEKRDMVQQFVSDYHEKS